jgi:pyruvate formate lyase activating enzyme
MRGTIFDIKRFAIHDGPGIRTTVFFKGCALRCDWCHNPESQAVGPTPMRYVTATGDDRHETTRLVGYTTSVDELVEEVARDFLCHEESDGGVTFSGGEPLLQGPFLAECLARCKELGIHTCVDTAGAVTIAAPLLDEICRHADLFLYDLKTLDPRKFERHVGRGLDSVKRNLRHVAGRGGEIVIRVPVIPGVNTGRVDTREIIAFLDELPAVRRVQLLPFHRAGAGKYERLGRTYAMGDTPALAREGIAGMTRWFREAGYDTL